MSNFDYSPEDVFIGLSKMLNGLSCIEDSVFRSGKIGMSLQVKLKSRIVTLQCSIGSSEIGRSKPKSSLYYRDSTGSEVHLDPELPSVLSFLLSTAEAALSETYEIEQNALEAICDDVVTSAANAATFNRVAFNGMAIVEAVAAAIRVKVNQPD